MKTYVINTGQEAISFTLCGVHQHALPTNGGERLVITQAAPHAKCLTCEQDKIRAAIRSLGSVVA